MHAGRFAEAEQVYRDDLKRLPENGWSLFGLSQALAAQEKDGAELEATRARFKKVWAKADVKITSSCLCRPSLTANCELNRTLTPPLLSAD
jgi:cytochrome c-type biogenesis protein CcmH/NrfG